MRQPPHPDPFGDSLPPAALRERLTTTLSAAGFIEPRAVRLRRAGVRFAAVAALAGAAFVGGRMVASAGAPRTSSPQFLFLLYEDSLYRDDRPVREIVAEYSAWADSLRGERALVIGEKLSNDRIAVSPGTVDHSVRQHPTGLFIVHAPSLEAATVLARTSPHLRYGGTVLVHRIE